MSPPTLEQRVAALERAQKAGPAADVMAPSFITVDPATGAVGVDFTGHVHAKGLDLDEAQVGVPPDTDRVRWLDPGGVAREFLAGVNFGGQRRLLAESTGAVGQDAQVFLAAIGDAGASSARIEINAGPGGTSVDAILGGPISRRISDTLGRSGFVQITNSVALGEHLLNIGTATVTFPGGSTNSGGVVVPHGLTDRTGAGVIPIAVLCQPRLTSALGTAFPTVSARTLVNFTLFTTAPAAPAAAVTQVVDWAALS